MAFVVKNLGSTKGSALIDGKWVDIAPGKFIKTSTKPLKRTVNIKCIEVDFPKVVKDDKKEDKKEDKVVDAPKVANNLAGGTNG